MTKSIQNQEKYQRLYEDCHEIITEEFDELAERVKAAITETIYSASMTLIEGKHKIGEEVATDPLYKKYSKGAGQLIKDIAQKINRSEQDLYFCVQFYKKYPVLSKALETLPEGKKISWGKIIGLLPEKKNSQQKKQYILVEVNKQTLTIFILKKYKEWQIKWK
jgi:frataxin-like iron-binding protein CyaY